MFYSIENGSVRTADPADAQGNASRQFWGVLSFEEAAAAPSRFGLEEKLLTQASDSRSAKFESHERFDFICLNLLNYKNVLLAQSRVLIYLQKNLILFICENPGFIENMIEGFSGGPEKNTGFEKLIYVFFENTTTHDAAYLEGLEQEVSALENALITSGKRDCVKEIITLRKKLMVLKRHYEQLLNVLDAISENENEILGDHFLRYFKIFSGRVDRLYHNVLNLRDYVTQVREAYQAEVDISLNSIMKLFTVLSAIFMPLTLIVGWYGMNLKMPEFSWRFGYPMVIGLSLITIASCIFLFKKYKWF